MSAVTSLSSVPDLVTGAKPLWQAAWGLLKRRVLTSMRPVSVVLRPGPLPKDTATLVLGHAAALAAWEDWCQAHAGSHCQVALSGHWLLSFAAQADQVASLWEHYFGVGAAALAEQWLVRSTAGQDGLSVVCAAPRALVQDLQASARAHGVKIVWMGPWWAPEVQAWLRHAGQPEQWAAEEPGLVTHLKRQSGLQEGREPGLTQIWTEVQDRPDASGKHPSHDLVAAKPWQKAPASPLVDTLDFVGPRVHTALWSWGLLVLGLAAAVAVADHAQQATKSLDEATQTLSRLERAKRQQQLARTAPRATREASASAPSVLNASALRQASGMIQLLAFPWSEVIGQVEQAAAQEQAVLTAFSLDLATLEGKGGTRPSVRLTLAMRDDAAALRWLAAQGDDAQLLSRQLLSTPFDTLSGHYALRYEATWAVDTSSRKARP